MRDLGTLLDHEKSPTPSGMRSGAVASQDHQRSAVSVDAMGHGTLPPFKFARTTRPR
jgi:hypothetical protein